MFESVCAFPLASDLFAQAVHPAEPLVAVGLSSGHVATLKLPPAAGDQHEDQPPAKRRLSNGTGTVDTAWRTKRHKGSCRCLVYSVDGQTLFSAGTDGIVKAADSETGRVTSKIAIPRDVSSTKDRAVDAPTVVHALSPQTLLLSTDSGALHLYDLRDPAPSLPINEAKTAFLRPRPSQTYHPHNDYISSLTPVPPSKSSTSGFSKQFLTTGSTTLALTDLRRGVLAKSEDQEELLLSSLYITGLAVKKSSGSTGEKAVVGGGDGVITLWEKGQWDDQDERITVSREKETLDCMVEIPDGVGGHGKKIAVGMGDGKVRFVRMGVNQIVGEVQHDELEGVVQLGFDVGGRMISGGGTTVKVWTETVGEGDDVSTKRPPESDNSEVEDDDVEADADSSADEKPYQRRQKRKRGKAKDGKGSFEFAGLD